MWNSLVFNTATLCLIALLSLVTVDQAQAKSCGGNNQSSCWSLDKNEWCDAGLTYIPGGLPGKGKCIKLAKPKPKPPKSKDCGGLNQSSCWSLSQDKWCDPGLTYVPGGLPGKGKCLKLNKPQPKECGGLNQSSCWSLSQDKWCNPGLTYVPGGLPGKGKCLKLNTPTKECGGLNQSSCWSLDANKWCNAGLEYVGTGKPGDGKCITPGSDYDTSCGGLGQPSCWNADPKRWCDRGLEYFGTGKPGEGTCIVPGTDPTPNCGGDGQQSCWNANPKHWCDDGTSYVPGIIPNQGTCERKYTKQEYRDASKQIWNAVQRVGLENPISNLRNCLMKPDNVQRLQQIVKSRSENGFDEMLKVCGAHPESIIEYGRTVMGYAPKTLKVGLSGGFVAGIGLDGAVTYAIPLELPEGGFIPDGRYLISNGISFGWGLAAGGDVSVGLSGEEMPTAHWVVEKGRGVTYSGKMLGGGSASIEFPERGLVPTGFSVGAGVGVGGEVGVVNRTRDQYLYNF